MAGLIPELGRDARGRLRNATARREGIRQVRHYYAIAMLAGVVTIKELAEYLGYGNPAFNLRVYIHMLPHSHERACTVINQRFTRMKPSSGVYFVRQSRLGLRVSAGPGGCRWVGLCCRHDRAAQ